MPSQQVRQAIEVQDGLLTAVIITDIIQGRAFIPELPMRQIQYLGHMELPLIGKYTEFVCIHTGNNIFILSICRLPVPLISRHINRFHIPKPIHQKDNWHFLRFLFLIDSFLCILNPGFPCLPIFLLEMVQLLDNGLCHGSAAA